MDEDHLDRKISKQEDEEEGAATVKPARSFRYEDYSTRRVFLRSYPLQWDWSPAAPDDEKQGLAHAGPKNRPACGSGDDDDGDGGGRGGAERCGAAGKGWRRQAVLAVVEWGEEKLLLLLRKAKRRLALCLLGCHRGRKAALPYRSGGSGTAAMLKSR